MITGTHRRDFVREYLSYLRVERGLSQNSLESYENDLTQLHQWAEENGLDVLKLTRHDLREWLIDLSAKQLASRTVARKISALRGFYKFLQFDKHITKNPAEDLVSPQKSSYLPKFLNQAEMEQLLLAPDVSTEIGLRDRAMLETMYAAGLRVSEVCSLKIGDTDLDAGILTCKGKGSKTRKVPLGKSSIEWLRSYLILRRKKETIEIENMFVTGDGNPLSRQEIYLMIRELGEKIGIQGISPHTLRHSFATHLIQNRADVRSVQQLLGHADISTTQIYTHVTNQHLKRAYDDFHPRATGGSKLKKVP